MRWLHWKTSFNSRTPAGSGEWEMVHFHPPHSSYLQGCENLWRHNDSTILQIFRLVQRAKLYHRVLDSGAWCCISRGKQSSFSLFHIIGLHGQIDNIWNIVTKKHAFPSSQANYYNLCLEYLAKLANIKQDLKFLWGIISSNGSEAAK